VTGTRLIVAPRPALMVGTGATQEPRTGNHLRIANHACGVGLSNAASWTEANSGDGHQAHPASRCAGRTAGKNFTTIATRDAVIRSEAVWMPGTNGSRLMLRPAEDRVRRRGLWRRRRLSWRRVRVSARQHGPDADHSLRYFSHNGARGVRPAASVRSVISRHAIRRQRAPAPAYCQGQHLDVMTGSRAQ